MSHQTSVSTAFSDRHFVLATDLDGTFLGGSDADRKRLYGWIEANRETIGLVFVTGRDPAFIRSLCDSGVPWPEYVIGDVGTTIAEVADRQIFPIAELEKEIASLWNDAGSSVRSVLDGHPGLTLQPTAFRHRVSYDLQPSEFDDSAKAKVEGLGHDWLISDDKYFDVLPRGVSKGPSLRRFVAHMNIPDGRVLAAGDTLNDASMLECGLPAVAVGGAEEALLDRVRHLPHVHKANAIGAGGILEAIRVMDLHPGPEDT
ncbi:HAD-IIB family hydrolase [Roseivivax sp. CAU 1753]